MAASQTTQAETEMRIARCARIIANGGRRSDCIQYAATNWGVTKRTVDNYLKEARTQLRADWDIERPQMIADLLSQCSTLQMEARRNGQLNIALGAINTAAKLADLCSRVSLKQLKKAMYYLAMAYLIYLLQKQYKIELHQIYYRIKKSFAQIQNIEN